MKASSPLSCSTERGGRFPVSPRRNALPCAAITGTSKSVGRPVTAHQPAQSRRSLRLNAHSCTASIWFPKETFHASELRCDLGQSARQGTSCCERGKARQRAD